ncbi:Exodeoxyribonuclease V, subunit alpha [Desulfonema limicola]|uniref:Exodeoxyribonuclease V, subunit alpha n=1 Tax=Desulfonema limicola TaxID=45656 RepID=A0A975B4F8_9BACT|nr:exodeoxyribonuclease V subunit alpha [Desulfonema limicola]QTA78604.1 Exodeoxyribonuclease V, subunit alpha [Desulfonema limicola]
MKQDALDNLYESGFFSYLDIRFARFISGLEGKNAGDSLLAAALVSRHQRQGHICFDFSVPQLPDIDNPLLEKLYPEPEAWTKSLRKSPAVGKPGEYKPLILDDSSRLYLYRYWEYQDLLAKLLREKIQSRPRITDTAGLKQGLNSLFPKNNHKGETDWQKIAAFAALTRNFCVISGGPGTGKTTTIAKILALIYEQAGTSQVNTALTAPTGKAAARLQEAVFREKNIFPPHIKEDVLGQASTIHRLLGSIPNSPFFRHNAKNLLPVDVLIVDEASMVDLALMSKLVQALDTRARLILLGDKDQLASVEAGSVLGDICDTGSVYSFSNKFCETFYNITGDLLACAQPDEKSSEICDCIVHLQKSYRFSDFGGIHLVSREINKGNARKAAAYLRKGNFSDIVWKKLSSAQDIALDLKYPVIQGFEPYLASVNSGAGIEEIFKNFERFRILCTLRQGPYGVVAVNNIAEQILKSVDLINSSQTWYKGRPVLITRNDYQLKLFNGDVGITIPDTESGNQMSVFFQSESGKFRKINPVRLPDHETVYAMTVHKSQGSEFDQVLLLLPDRDTPVLTRELIYTGITRAIHNVEIWCEQKIFNTAVSRSIRRSSGLRDALWG